MDSNRSPSHLHRAPPSTKARLAVIGLVAMAVIPVFAARAAQTSTTQPPPTCAKLNLALIVLDAAGARHFSSYGNPRPTTPSIDTILADATIFERAYAQAPATVKSMSSLLTGKYAPSIERTDEPYKLEEEHTLAMLLEGAGYRTAAFSQNPWVNPTFGFGNGFQTFEKISGDPVQGRPRTGSADLAETPFTEAVAQWIDATTNAPFFLYAHLIAPHSPYTPPKPYAGSFDPGYSAIRNEFDVYRNQTGELVLSTDEVAALRLAYQEHLAYGDAQVGSILHHLKQSGLFDSTLIIVTSDHGEAFGEHGRMTHATTVYDEMLHVPLFIRWPACLGALPRRYSHPTELRRLYATIADALGVDGTDRGDSLLAVLRGPASHTPAPVRADAADPFTPRRVRMVIVGSHKLVQSEPGELELYDLRKDPGERHNIAKSRADLIAEMLPILRIAGDEVRSGQVPEIDAATREKLRALGYNVD